MMNPPCLCKKCNSNNCVQISKETATNKGFSLNDVEQSEQSTLKNFKQIFVECKDCGKIFPIRSIT